MHICLTKMSPSSLYQSCENKASKFLDLAASECQNGSFQLPFHSMDLYKIMPLIRTSRFIIPLCGSFAHLLLKVSFLVKLSQDFFSSCGKDQ
jgi:hypothetical protein